jgi:succinylarginine dihydrolase
VEAQIIGLPGPSHYYGGLAEGNQASLLNSGNISSPKAAAIQCLDYMEFLYKKNVPTLWLPPHPRPIKNCYSSSFMWVANAGSFISGINSLRQSSFFRPANLLSHSHRSIELKITNYLFEQILKNTSIQILTPDQYPDEGAANQMSLLGSRNMEVLVYNKVGLGRQSLKSMKNLASMAQIKNPVFIQQNSAAVRAGVFHNDVIAMSCGRFTIFHEDAFEDIALFTEKLAELGIHYYVIKRNELSIKDSISSYLFNSNWYELNGERQLVLAEESNQPAILTILLKLIDLGFIHKFTFLDLKQSMQNGGGPACLRFRIPISPSEWHRLNVAFKIDAIKLQQLREWVEHFPKDLTYDQLNIQKNEFIQIWKMMPNFHEIWQEYLFKYPL